jgi:cytochrome b subunit of formate dehydrogenase
MNLLLDDNQCPVARTRLFSAGINKNNRIFNDELITGDRGCMTCGNCVDACPVVREMQRFIPDQNQRTSMALENMVGEECRRCYNCIKACPQVDKEIKEYAAGFRRGERVVHMLIALTMVSLACTGIVMSHLGDMLPVFEFSVLKYGHRGLGIILGFMPFLYLLLDGRHMLRLLKRVFVWGKSDWEWIKALLRHIGNHKVYPMPYTGEFNTGQRAWYLYVTIALPALFLTGLMLMMAQEGVAGSDQLSLRLTHMGIALITDILLFIHIYLKYLRKWARLIYDLVDVFLRKRHLNYYVLHHKEVD